MFFNRFGKHASMVQPSALTNLKEPLPAALISELGKKTEKTENQGLRRAVALALATQFALPLGLLGLSSCASTHTAGPMAAPTKPGSPTTGMAMGTTMPATAPAMVTDASPATAPVAAPADATPPPTPATPTATAPVAPSPAAPASAMAAAVTPPATSPAPVATTPATSPAMSPATAPMPAAAPVAAAPATAPEDKAADDALRAAATYNRIKQQQAVYAAQKLVEKARDEQSKSQTTDALRDYQEATRLDPNNEQARVGYAEVLDLTGHLQRPPAQTQGKEIQEQIQAIQYRFNSSIGRANADITAGKWNDAQRDIDDARVASRNNPSLFTQSQINDFDTILSNTEVNLTTAKAQADEISTRKAETDSAKAQAEKEARYKLENERTVANLIQDARQYSNDGKYREALAVIDHIQQLDPTNEYASDNRAYLEDKANIAEQREYREKFDTEFTHVLNASQEKKIPYSDIIRYSDDWPKISEMRDNEVKADRGEDEEDAQLQAQLDRHLPELRFNANALSDVIDFLRDMTGTNIYVDWPALERASIAKDAQVTARLRDIKFSKALELIFKSVEGEDDEHKLGYSLDQGVITISTRKELNKDVLTRKYDINDLLFVAPDYNDAPNLSLQNASQGQTGGGGGGGQSNSLFTNANGNQNQQNQANQRSATIDEIKKYITDNVDTNSWKDNGGDVGTISSSPLRAVLLITQTGDNQKKIQSVLDSLRASQSLQVSVETRFLVVQRNYLEDIGVNASFTFNPLQQAGNSRSGYNSSRFTPITVSQSSVTDNTTFTDANGNVTNSATGSRQLDWISNVGNTSVPGSIAANPADYPNPIVIQGSYVDNFTVNFLIRAVEANQSTVNLTAPRLTLFSGQRAVLIVETQQAYVSDLTPVVAPGAALFDPQVSTTTAEGVVLSLLATVSPDRKYVFMDLQPQLARLQALVPFVVSAVVTPTTSVLGTTTGASQIVQGTLQLPELAVTQVKTSCSVPDGATLLLGGQTLAAETTREQGVPVLSKIPFLKRLFTNRATSQDEQILLILVKPTILIQHEQEQKQFPQLSTKAS